MLPDQAICTPAFLSEASVRILGEKDNILSKDDDQGALILVNVHDGILDCREGGHGLCVCPSQRLLNDVFHHSKCYQLLGRDP